MRSRSFAFDTMLRSARAKYWHFICVLLPVTAERREYVYPKASHWILDVRGLNVTLARSMPIRTSLISLLEDAARCGDEIAFVQRRGLRVERWTYTQLAATTAQFACELDARQIAKGDRVLLWGASGGAWVAVWFGCLARGVIVVPLDEHSAPDFAERVQTQVNAKLLVGGQEQAGKLALPCMLLDELRAAVSHHPATLHAVAVQPEELAQIIFTSGTTAEPKGVCLSHRNLLANLEPLERGIDEYRKWERPFHPLRFLCLLPLSHVFGQFMGIFVPQLLGGEVHFLDSHNPADIIAVTKQARISAIAAVPRQLETLRDKLERDYAQAGKLEDFKRRFVAAEGKHPLARMWRFRDVHRRFGWKCWAFVVGGATLPAETEQFWMRLGFAVVQGYGMTETASLVSVNHPFKLSQGSIGKTLPGQELKLDTDGTIMVRGANVAAGYWRAGQAETLTGDEGWLRTGDIGAVDGAGNLFFKGRAKDIIVTAAGLNIYPADLEAALDRQSEVKASCVVGVEGANGPEAFAVVVLHDSAVDVAEVVKRANANLNAAQHIRRWMVWPEADFPRTTTQKIRKPMVRQFVEASQHSDGAAAAMQENTWYALLAQVSGRSATEVQSLPPTADLSAGLGLDSLGRVALLSALEDRFQLELDETAITQQTTLAELPQLVQPVTPLPVAQTENRSAPFQPQTRTYPYPSWALHGLTRGLRLLLYYLLVLPATRLLCWTHNRGVENLQDLREPALFICNHISMVDHGLILAALPWRFRHRLAIAMEGERLRGFRHPAGDLPWWLRVWRRVEYVIVVVLFNVFPLPQQSGFRRSFAYAGQAVDRGYSVLVFPEGRVTTDGAMRPFMSGIGLLAKNLGVPVVPLRIDGLYERKRLRRWWAWPGSVRVAIGKPVQVDGALSEAQLAEQFAQRVKELEQDS